jgi:glycosyltransferase involved in cell wall biosynthesis
MDIAFLTTSLARGGAETQLVRIATTLARRGWQVGILTMFPSELRPEEVERGGIPWVEYPGRLSRVPLRLACHLTRQLRQWRPQVLVTFNYPADVVGRICGRLAGVPRIISGLRTAQRQPPFRERFYRYTEPLITLTVSNSQAALDAMAARKTLTLSKTAMIHNGLILGEYPAALGREQARSRLGLPDNRFLWLAVGNLRPAKDYPTLLEAAAQCLSQRPDFKLIIVGDGPDRDELERRSTALALMETVEFLGSRADVPEILRAADAYVLSSAWEGSPNTLMEAMASNLPAVATDVGDVRDLVERAGAGYVVPPRDPRRLAEGMLALMSQKPDLRQEMGAKGRDLIMREFENDRVVDIWEALLRRVASGLVPVGPGQPPPTPFDQR